MTINSSDLVLQCEGCQHVWVVAVKLPMPMEEFVRVLKKEVRGGCIKCGLTARKRAGAPTIVLLLDAPRREAIKAFGATEVR